jgi:hypothetical protein
VHASHKPATAPGPGSSPDHNSAHAPSSHANAVATTAAPAD